MRFKINWRFLAKLSVVVLVALIAVHFTHAWQVRQQAGAFLRQADAARDAAERDDAATEREITYLKRYLVARPTEIDVRERLGRLLCKSAKSRNQVLDGYLVVQDVLRRDPGRDELRRFAITFAMEPRLGLYAEALTDLDILLNKRKDDGELEALKARCFVQTKKNEEANACYRNALTHRPDLIDAAAGRAVLLRLELNQPGEADKVIAKVLENNREKFRAHLLVAEYWRMFWPLERSAFESCKLIAESQELQKSTKVESKISVADAIGKAVTEAQKLAPDELDVILAVSDLARFTSYEQARSRDKEVRERAKTTFAKSHNELKVGLAKHPQAPAIYLALAAREAEQRQEKEPVAVIKEGLAAIPDSPPLMTALLNYQILGGDAPGATETLDKLKKVLTPVQVEFHEGRILMLKGEWVKASLSLDHVRNNVSDNPALVREANLLLGRCYEQLGVLDRRLDAFTRAVPVDTTDALWVPAMIGVAEAEAALGRIDACLQAYMKLKDRAAGAWLQIARLRMLKALQASTDQKLDNADWRETEEALAIAEDVLPKDNTEVRILRASLLSVRGNATEARKRLEALKLEKPKDVTVRLALAEQDLRDGNPGAALKTLEVAEAETGDSPAIRVARGLAWVETKDPQLTQKIESLVAGAEKFTPEQQRVLLRGLAELAPGSLKSQLWDRVAALQRFDLGVHLTRLDLALRAGNEDQITNILREIRDADGETGSSSRLGRAIYLIWRAQHKQDNAGLDEAAALLAGLERERRGGARATFAQALVLDLRGDLKSARAKYQQAVDAGEASPDALRRLMELLRLDNKFAEAEVVLKKLPKASIANGATRRIAAEVSLRTNNVAQAISYANQAVSENSPDPAEHIWLGQIYFGAGEPAKAEAAFRKATGLRPEAPDVWLPLVQYLALTNRKSDAEQVIEDAKSKVIQDERALFLGLGYALIGKVDKASAAYKQARLERPAHLRTLQAEADFFLQYGKLDKDGKNADAIEAFQRVIALQTASADDKDFARRMIVICLASSPNYTVSRQALSELGLLQGNQLRPLTGNETAQERHTRTITLALQRDQASRLEAIRMLKAESDPSPDDQFLLAQLYRSVGDHPQVHAVMAGLLRKNDRVSRYVQFYAAWLLQIGDHGAADKWVKQLAELQPDALVTAELRARLAAAKGDARAARELIVPRADAPDAPVLAIARVCESIKLYKDAERLFRLNADKTKEKQPEAPLLLAAFYGRRGQTAEALRICDEVRRTVPVGVVGVVAVAALYDTPAPQEADAARVAGWLDDAAQKATGETRAALVQLLASVRNLQGQFAESIKLYDAALEANPRDVLALNNRAFLISALEKNHDQALQLIDRAKQIRGPLPTLLDTEALIRLEKKEFDRARQLLEVVTSEAPSGTAYYHLARVELAVGRKLEAKRAWQQSQDAGIKFTDLHPLERPEFTRVSDLLK